MRGKAKFKFFIFYGDITKFSPSKLVLKKVTSPTGWACPAFWCALQAWRGCDCATEVGDDWCRRQRLSHSTFRPSTGASAISLAPPTFCRRDFWGGARGTANLCAVSKIIAPNHVLSIKRGAQKVEVSRLFGRLLITFSWKSQYFFIKYQPKLFRKRHKLSRKTYGKSFKHIERYNRWKYK